MALPPLTPEQRAAALEKAAAARRERAEIKNRLKHSGASLSEVVHEGQKNDVVGKMKVSALLESMPGVGKVRAKQIMERLAAPTGGRAFTTDSIDELHVAFDELLDELSHQYLIGYQSTNAKHDDTWREIKVEVDGHKAVRARQGYRAAISK